MQEDYHNTEEESHSNHIHPTKFNSGQKIAVFVLAIFAFFAISMWAIQFKKSITTPFAYNSENNQNNTNQVNEENLLREKDTDGDSISDWDELYLYETSPYLEDSDSDGLNDYEEISVNSDPNCPAGRNCYASPAPNTSNTNEVEKNDNNDTQLTIPGSNNGEEDLQKILGGSGDADSLRKMLIDAGMDKKILDQISDEDLLKSYNDILNK